ncbi:MAG: S1/P1 nuclease [Methanoregulaceae archaeon]|nr:S1/P1 nuclease [Methanoregulaceae archaeon]
MTWRSAFLIPAALTAAHAAAWTDTGHMLVSAVAETQLNSTARQAIAELLQEGGDEKTRDLLGAACWADDTKTDQNGPWHYINYHFRHDGQPSENEPLEENVVWAISKFADAMADPNLPAAQRADAVRYVLHFVGDVHQPLHTVACDSEKFPKGDRGGNDFLFDPFNIGTFQVRNLHFLWDLGGGLYGNTPRPLVDREPIDTLRDRLMAEHPKESMPELKIEDPERWAREGVMLAQTLVYGTPEKIAPSSSYLAMTQFVSGRRIVMAGYRLADMLNRTFGGERNSVRTPTVR